MNTRAIVLSKKSFQERDAQVVLYSKDFGKITLLARGTKRINSKLSAHLEPFTFLDLMIVKGRNFDYIAGAVSINSFLKLKKDYEKLVLIGKIFDFFKKNTKENIADLGLYNLLLDFLFLIDNFKINKFNFVYNVFVLRFLFLSGFALNLDFCYACKAKSKDFYFNYSDALFVCQTCFLKKKTSQTKFLKISPNLLVLLKQIANSGDLKFFLNFKVGENLSKELDSFVKHFYLFRKT